jgi:hypothetical protein
VQRLLIAALIVLTLVTIGHDGARADSSDLTSVMQKYVSAVGGREALSKIHSSMTVYKSTIMGHIIMVTTTAKAPFYYLQVLQPEGSAGKMSFGFDGTTAWMQSPDGAVATLTGEKRAEVISEAVGANNSEVFPDRWPTTVTLKPAEAIDGKSYTVLSVKAKDGVTHDLFIDPETNLPVIERSIVGGVTSLSVVEAFGKGPMGELQAHIIVSTRSDGTPQVTSVLREVQDNADVSNSIFAPPLGTKGAQTI